ncbi:dipeptide ABC transporter ATP-binding protein [Pseudonocardia kunmingensis]|uniref:Peptide/nickel transport system ATP-binding protein n=1 Tax=Pseudonocardia kunmingensis TaxID=630975 RepID=A0A543DIW9_9PSEU|nr:ABC transporter ATP-binding protein [Pseudonocardia kunmingensis]TQM09263.1 peptide/nickel transport system ATP-binding protein [Pseudonocardia kunmingensis]
MTTVSATADESTAALEVDDLHVTFTTDEGDVPAVRGVRLAVARGRVLALVGESGSGKSVTAMSVLGLLPRNARTSGRVSVGGTDVVGLTGEDLRRVRGARVGMVFQEPATALNPSMTVGAQVAEALRNHGTAKDVAAARAVELLTEVGIPDAAARAGRYPHEFSGGQRQRVVIAIAIACEPEVIIADEPTTALDVTVQAEILDLLRRLVQERGAALFLITHNMGVVADIADDVAVMYQGRVVEQGPVQQVLTAPSDDYTARLLAAVPELPRLADEPAAADEVAPADGDALRLEGVCVDYGRGRRAFRAVTDVDLVVGAREIVGVVGESGSGKSTLARAAVGLVPIAAGSASVLGSALTGHGRRARLLRARIGIVFQDPAGSLDPRMTVGESVAEPFRMHPDAAGRPNRAERRTRVTALLDAVRLPGGTLDRYPHELSGGQRQRVALARALALRPGLLIADEPTSALDVSVQQQVLDVLREVHTEFGFGCLFISHDLAVVHEIADRVAVMRGGVIVEHGSADRVLGAPREPYSRALVAAAPSLDPVEQRRRRELRLTAL